MMLMIDAREIRPVVACLTVYDVWSTAKVELRETKDPNIISSQRPEERHVFGVVHVSRPSWAYGRCWPYGEMNYCWPDILFASGSC